jgi:hypothetical protein
VDIYSRYLLPLETKLGLLSSEEYNFLVFGYDGVTIPTLQHKYENKIDSTSISASNDAETTLTISYRVSY